MAVLERKKRSRKQLLDNHRIINVTRDFDPYFSNGLLEEILEFHEEGHKVEDIAETLDRPVMEIIYALLFLANEGLLKRPFAYRGK